MLSTLKSTRNQRPSEDLAILSNQLRQALEELSDDDGPQARDFRRFVRRAMAKAWRAAMTGEAGKLSDIIEAFREARPMVDDALPNLSPRSWAAVEMQQTLAVLYLGEDELRELQRKALLTDRGRHPTERSVLEVLAATERPLRQKEVYDQMTPALRPSASRVGQILRELYRDRYLQKQLARARGCSEVAHYHLSPRGRDLCQQAGISVLTTIDTTDQDASATDPSEETGPSKFTALAQVYCGPDWMQRRVVSGLFQSAPNRDFARSCLSKIRDVSPTSGRLADPKARGALNELAQELNLITATNDTDVFNEVHLVTQQY